MLTYVVFNTSIYSLLDIPGLCLLQKTVVVTVAQVFGKNVWASDIEWSVVRHTREKKDKIKGCFERVRLLLVAGGQKGLAVVTVSQCQNKWV
jgi:hypothetical protein